MASAASPWTPRPCSLCQSLEHPGTTTPYSRRSFKCPTKRKVSMNSQTKRCITSYLQDYTIFRGTVHPTTAGSGFHELTRISMVGDIQVASSILSNPMMGPVIADLDPGTAKLAIGIVGPLLSALGFLFILRIVMSWYPKLPVGKFPYVVAFAPTEPLLIPTRKLIPPLGGVDVTPVVWFGLVSFLNEILVGPQGILVLLSQQV